MFERLTEDSKSLYVFIIFVPLPGQLIMEALLNAKIINSGRGLLTRWIFVPAIIKRLATLP